METTKRLPGFSRDISKETRAWVLERNAYTCQMCGVAAGDPDPFGSNRTIRLTMGHILDKSKGGDDTPKIYAQFVQIVMKVCRTQPCQNQIKSICLAR